MRKNWIGLITLCILFAAVIMIAVSPGFAVMKDKDDGNVSEGQIEYVPDEIIVKFKPDMDETEKKALKEKAGIETVKKHALTGSELVKIKTKDKVQDVITKLKKHPKVVYAEPNFIVHAQADVNDPKFGELWGIHNTGQVIKGVQGVADVDVDAPEAWDNELGSPEVVVGIIDTGLDISHPDLVDNIWTNPGEIAGDGIDNDGNGFIDDIHGWDFYNDHASVFEAGDHFHATHVAGTIAGIANNGIGVAGVAPRVKIMAIQFLGPGGSGTISDAIDAVGYAAVTGIKITNNSWGGGGYSQALYDAIVNWGGAFVAAAGNSSVNADISPMYPAAYNCSNIISVAAINNQGGLAYFSNYGATTVDVGAPGLDVLSCMPGNSYGYLSGTSMATPHVAGITALILSRAPEKTPEAIRELIMESATPLASLQGITVSGGMAKAASALMKLDVRYTDPANGAIEVPIDKTITVTYNMEVQAGTEFGSISLKTGETTAAIVSHVSGSVLTIDPVSDLELNKAYTVTIPAGAVQKTDGTPLASYTFSFKTPDTIFPAITGTDPADGSTTVLATQTVTVTISEKVIKGSNFGQITLKSGTSVVQSAINITGSVLSIDPVLYLGNNTTYTVTIPDGAITDPSGNALAAYTFGFSTLPDALPPTVQGSDPANNATKVPVDKTITVTFSESIQEATNFSLITLKTGSTTVQSSVTIGGNIVSIDPASNLNSETDYTVTIPAESVKDTQGNMLQSGYTFNFKTADIIPPAVSSTNPANNAVNVPLSTTITVNLTENTEKGPNFANILLKDEAGNIVTARIDYARYKDEEENWYYDTRVIVIDPVADLQLGKRYIVTIPANAVKDLGGLGNEAYVFSFRTPFSVTSTDPANGATRVPVDKTITVTFSENAGQGPNFNTITLKAGATAVQSALSISGNVLTIDPAANLANDTTYTVTIPADSIRNPAGVAVNAYSFNFRTLDIIAPAVTGSTPANGATNIAVGTTITVNLSEETSQGPNFGAIVLKDAAGNTVNAGVDYHRYWDDWEWAEIVNTALIVIDPVANLEMGKVYIATVPADAVRDKDGNPNSQYSFSFKTPFVVTTTSPANNETRVPVGQTITATLSDAGVQGPNFNTITLKAGATTVQTALSINGNVLTIDPVANLGNDTTYTVTIPADSIRNSAGVSVNAYSFSFRTLDIIAPAVTGSTPANGATNVAVGTTITVNLSEETSQGPNFGAIVLKDAAGNTVSAGVDYSRYWDDWEWAEIVDTRLIVIDPVANLAMGTVYTVTVPADSVRDKDGNPNSQYSFSFKTPFVVTTTSPANNATQVPVGQTITATLSDAGVQGPNFNAITLKAGSTTVQSAISLNGNILTIDPVTDLANDASYTVTIPADSIRNSAGVSVNAYSFNFRTLDIIAPAVTGSTPANGATNIAVGTTIFVNLSEETSQGPNFGAIVLKDEAGNTVNAAVDYLRYWDDWEWAEIVDTTLIVIDPIASLEMGKIYIVSVPADSVRDKDGNPNSQYSFSFKTPFAVMATSPANNETRVPVGQTITATLSEAGSQGPNFNTITLKAGAATIETSVSINGNVLTIDPVADLSNDTYYTVTIPSDSIRNSAGVAVNQHSFSFRTVDINSPAVSSTDPANNATSVAVGTNIQVNLTEETSTGPNFGGIVLKDAAGNSVSAAVDYLRYWDDWEWAEIVNTALIVIDPAANLEMGKIYTVTVPDDAVRDKDANPNVQYSFSFSFSTPFLVTATSPANNATQVPVGQTITVTLSDAGVQGPGFSSITLKAGATTIETGVSLNGNVLTIDPVADLSNDTTYTVTIPADSIRNVAGVSINAYSFSFRTVDIVAPAISGSTPANNATSVPVGTTINVNLTEETTTGPNFSGIVLKDAAGNTVNAVIDFSRYWDDWEWAEIVNTALIVIDPVANLEMGKVYTVTVPADAVRDKDGNPNSQYSFSFSTPFIVTATNPANNATGVPVNQTITVTLIGNGTQGPAFNSISLKAGSATVNSAVSINGNVLTIDPASDLDYDTTYEVDIPADAIRDEHGKSNSKITFRFSTRYSVTSSNPANRVIRFPADQMITVTLSEAGVQGPAFSSITLKAGATTIETGVSLNGNVLTIDPVANLANDTTFTVTIPADSIRNAAGVSLDAYSFSFRTLDIVAPAVTGSTPANNATNVAVGTTINVNLSEETSQGPNFGGIVLKDAAGNTVNAVIDYHRYWDDWEWAEIVNTALIVIDPAANLEMGTTYTVTVPADSVRDKDANPNVQYSFSFSTPL